MATVQALTGFSGSWRFVAPIVGGVLLALAVFVAMPAAADASGLSAGERGQFERDLGPGANVAYHEETGQVRFIGTGPGQPIDRPDGQSASASPQAVAIAFLARHGDAFGVGRADELEVTGTTTSLPQDRFAVRLRQLHRGVPVLAGELVVNLDAKRNILSASGEVLPDAPPGVDPAIAPGDAADRAVEATAKERGVDAGSLSTSDPRLEIFDSRLLGGPGLDTPQLVWRVEVSGDDLTEPIRELVLVDAELGGVALSFNQIAEAKDREVCDSNNTSAQYPCTSPVRVEGGAPSAVTDVNLAYAYAGHTYDLFATVGRDSLDDAGMTLVSTVRHCPVGESCPYENAFWDGDQMVYGAGYAAADDVVGHELTHGVTDFSSHLFYYYQSGAINESLSDVFGELVDLGNGSGTDTAAVRWLMGEDIPGIGAIRDMENPPAFGDPDRMQSPNYTGTTGDNGGVHTNSGVNNKAAFLMTDGGTFNGRTVTGLGAEKVKRIYYEANNNLLVSGSDYLDLHNALGQACTNLIGTAGITTANCVEVGDATLAVEMNQSPGAAPATDAEVCPTGQTVVNSFLDNLENPASGNWVLQTDLGSNEWYYPQSSNPYGIDRTYATSGDTHFWGFDRAATSDYSIAKATGVMVPAGAKLHFRHAYDFETSFDGGVVEYSTNNGATWLDAGPLAEVNGYTGNVSGFNPDRQGYTSDSNGQISSRYDLSSLAGQSVRIRFRIGTDSSVSDLGWFIDDIRIYRCSAGDTTDPVAKAPLQEFVTGRQLGTDTVGASIPVRVRWAEGTDNATAPGDLEYRLQQSVDGGPYTNVGGYATTNSRELVHEVGADYRYRVLARDAAGNVSAAAAGLTLGSYARQETWAQITYSTGWLARLARPGAFGGFVRPTTTVGAEATASVSGFRNVAVVMQKAESFGSVRVRLLRGATVLANQTIDLSPATGLGARNIVYARNGLNPDLTYSLEISDASGRIELDAFSLLG